MNELKIGSTCTGYGGLETAVQAVLGGSVLWHCEYEPPTPQNPNPTQAAARLLAHRYPNIPNHGDIATLNWANVEPVDVLTAGFPCQDVSAAGRRRGLRPGTRSGLWSHIAYAINVLKPQLVVIENVRGLLSADAHCDLEPCPWCLGDNEGRPLRALGAVLGDLASIGYVGRWRGIRAADVGAPHGRFRVFITAWPAADSAGPGWRRHEPQHGNRNCAEAVRSRQTEPGRRHRAAADSAIAEWRGTEPEHLGSAADRTTEPGERVSATSWGEYEPSIRRWELILGRPAPAPTLTGKRGGQQLSPRFVEWFMGLPAGWVTGVPGLSRNDQLKLLGNGVVPQQAEVALRLLLSTVERAA